MNRITRLFAVAAIALAAVGCAKVDPGHVGIRVASFGGGVQTEVVEPGRWIYNGPGYTMYEYPVFKQTATWTGDNSITFQTGDSMSVSADVGMTYHIGQQCVTKFFSEYRVPIDQVTNTFVLNNVRSAFNNYAGSIKDAAFLIPGKQALLGNIKGQLKKDLEPNCLFVDDVYLVSEFGLPPQIKNAINAKIQATQMAAQRQNELAQSQAEAAKAVAEATGQKDSAILKAEGEARAIQIKGDALRNNPGLIELERVQAAKIAASRWNGAGNIVPNTVIGDSANKGMIFNLPAQQ